MAGLEFAAYLSAVEGPLSPQWLPPAGLLALNGVQSGGGTGQSVNKNRQKAAAVGALGGFLLQL
jgi:hypothetical protein